MASYSTADGNFDLLRDSRLSFQMSPRRMSASVRVNNLRTWHIIEIRNFRTQSCAPLQASPTQLWGRGPRTFDVVSYRSVATSTTCMPLQGSRHSSSTCAAPSAAIQYPSMFLFRGFCLANSRHLLMSCAASVMTWS
jgi:hypothetical protein